MQLRCSCGAILPDDARFCHKCGAPQYAEDIERLNAQDHHAAPVVLSAAAVPPPLKAPASISFRNARAVSVSLVVAACAIFATGLTGMVAPVMPPLILLASGFVAVMLYRKGSAEPLSTASGARLGWMTGIWLFLVVTVILTAGGLYLSSSAGAEAMAQLRGMPQFPKSVATAQDLLKILPMAVVQTFFMSTLLPGLGGILGAKLTMRNRPQA